MLIVSVDFVISISKSSAGFTANRELCLLIANLEHGEINSFNQFSGRKRDVCGISGRGGISSTVTRRKLKSHELLGVEMSRGDGLKLRKACFRAFAFVAHSET